MIRFYKIRIVTLFCFQLTFISFITRSQSNNGGGTKISCDTGRVLKQFKHYFKDTLPTPKNYVSDYADIFTQEQENVLNQLSYSFDIKTTNQIAIVTFDTAMVAEKDFDSLAFYLFNAWRVGQKDKNNGILIGICTGYRKIRIENGSGIVKVLPDASTKIIIDSIIIPWYRKEDYFNGTLNGVKSIIQQLNVLQQ